LNTFINKSEINEWRGNEIRDDCFLYTIVDQLVGKEEVGEQCSSNRHTNIVIHFTIIEKPNYIMIIGL
jgi:hypothetical protein